MAIGVIWLLADAVWLLLTAVMCLLLGLTTIRWLLLTVDWCSASGVLGSLLLSLSWLLL